MKKGGEKEIHQTGRMDGRFPVIYIITMVTEGIQGLQWRMMTDTIMISHCFVDLELQRIHKNTSVTKMLSLSVIKGVITKRIVRITTWMDESSFYINEILK